MKINDRSVSESAWVPSVIETGRIMNVNINDWSVDVISELANKRYFDLQVMSPYFHFANGEGIYAMPEVGAMVWICKPTQGRFGAPFILGYQAPYDLVNANFRDGRQNLNPGDIMMRTRDENFLILRRGGVVQIGSNAITQRMFIPIQNFIKDFCENYQLNTFGGTMQWTTDRTDQTTTGDVPTVFSLLAKQLASDPAQVASLTVGSHGQNDPTILSLTIFESGQQGAKAAITMTMDNAGNVTWTLEKDWNVTTTGDINFESTKGNVSFKSDKGTMALESNKDMTVTSDQGNVTVTSTSGTIKEKSQGHVIDAPSVALGGANAKSPLTLGDQLVTWLTNLITGITTAQSTAPGSPIAFTAGPSLTSQLNSILSAVSKTM